MCIRDRYNEAFYGRRVAGSAYPWCVTFVWWVFREAGFFLAKTASCSELRRRYQAAGQWVTEGYPVSYTHLDVYKRQRHGKACPSTNRTQDGSFYSVSSGQAASRARRSSFPTYSRMVSTSKSVSYTHLSQVLGGALAGIGGGVEMLGRYSAYSWNALPGYGWTGITVAILAGNNPAFVPLAAFFMRCV